MRVASAEGRRRLPRRVQARRHPAAGLRLQIGRRARAATSSISRSQASARPGRLSSRPAMDPVLQAYTGLMNENRGEDGIPHRVPVIVVDMSTALYAFQALSAALYARRDETRGRYIDVSLMQAATALQSIRLMACHLEGGVMKPGGAPGGVFKIADGWMSLLAFNDRDWRILCKAMQMPALADDPRFATPEAAARQRRGAVRHRAARHCRRTVGRMDQAADRSRPDARAAQQLRRIPRPAACARDRPDPVAHAGWPQPGRCRCPPCPACCPRPRARRAERRLSPASTRRKSWPRTALPRPRSTRCWRSAPSPALPEDRP